MTRAELIDRAEAGFVRALVALFETLGPVRASNFGGWFGRTVGPLLPSHKVVRGNLARAFPELPQAERDHIGRQAWDNVGRVMAELVHLPRIIANTSSGPGCESVGTDIVAGVFGNPAAAIFFSAHLSNWEIMIPKGIREGRPMAGVYRAPQRSGVDRILVGLRQRAAGAAFPLFRKGAAGARETLGYLRTGGKLALLMDQKLNEGIAVPFFGRPAMTAPAAAKFALLLKAPVIPAHIERIGPARYRMVVEPALPLPNSGDREQDVRLLSEAINFKIEQWVRARPGEWLWMHRRWPKED